MKATNKTKTITLVSHYNKGELRLRLTSERYGRLIDALATYDEYYNKYPDVWDVIEQDRYYLTYGEEPKIFSRYQLSQIITSLYRNDYYDAITE